MHVIRCRSENEMSVPEDICMLNVYSSFCDDFYFDMCVSTEMNLPNQRDTVLTFFERLQKQFPQMCNFYRRGKNEYCLEGSQTKGQYQCVTLESNRISSATTNPDTLEAGYALHRTVLELAPYMLSLSQLDVSSMDVTFGMDFDCFSNHDEVIAEALLDSSAFGFLLDMPQVRPLELCPSITIALSNDESIQARLTIDSGTSTTGINNHQESSQEPINLSLTIRRYPRNEEKFNTIESLGKQSRLAQDLMSDKIIPYFIKPLTTVITEKRLS